MIGSTEASRSEALGGSRVKKEERKETDIMVGTFNIGRGWRSKAKKTLRLARKSGIDFLGLQETDNSVLIGSEARRAGYTLFYNKRAALLIKRKWVRYVVSVKNSDDGRVVTAKLDVNGKTLTVSSAYLPTALDAKNDQDEDMELARSIAGTVGQLSQKTDVSILLADMNETVCEGDRSGKTTMKHAGRGRISDILKAYGFRDAYKMTRSNKNQEGFTCNRQTKSGRVSSRIDYVYVKAEHLEVKHAKVGEFKSVKSDHKPVLVTAHLGLEKVHDKTEHFRLFLPKVTSVSMEARREFAMKVAENLRLSIPDIDGEGDVDKLATMVAVTIRDTAFETLGGPKRRGEQTNQGRKLDRRARKVRRMNAAAEAALSQPSLEGVLEEWKHVERKAPLSMKRKIGKWGRKIKKNGIEPVRARCMRWIQRQKNRAREMWRRRKEVEENDEDSYHWKDNAEARVHKMMRNNEGNSLDSVIDPQTGRLVTAKNELFEILEQTMKERTGRSEWKEKERPKWFESLRKKNERLQGICMGGDSRRHITC